LSAGSLDATFGLDESRVRRVRRRVLRWGRAHYRVYPWRTERDAWLTLVAEILLQRTRATQVDPVFRHFSERFPTARDLVNAGEGAARQVMERLGLHFRGALLYAVAVAIAERGGTPPTAISELRNMSGVGPYTTAAWLSLHRGHRAVIVDANVARWLSRMTGLPYNRDPRHVRWVNQLADALTPRRSFRDYNYAVLDFTMDVCTARDPHCHACPLIVDCLHGSTRGSGGP
jgi:A/G-specific adenine glycosylase